MIRVFSTSNVIKVENTSLLSNESLDDLLLLNTDKVPLSSFNPERAIELWWSDKTRRPNQQKRKKYKKRQQSKSKDNVIILDSDSDHSEEQNSNNSASSSGDDSDVNSDLLEEWEHLIELAS